MSSVGEDAVSAEPLERLHALLVEAVRRKRGADPHASPVTVAEIYQELVPYRSVRTALGLELNADYEHTLLRLLSGERSYARVEPAAAREQLERELDSPNPNVTLYRKFAGCDVWLRPTDTPTPNWVSEHLAQEAAPEATAIPDPGAASVPPAASNDEPWDFEPLAGSPVSPPPGAERARQMEQAQPMTTEQARAVPAGEAAAAARGAGGDDSQCAFCDSALPAERRVRFCPYCGQDQDQRPCARCGEPLQPDWAFCIACGAAADGAAA